MSLRTSPAFAVALVTLAACTDILAYSIAVPVLPDLSRRLGASPTIIGFLFASFGLTVLAVSVPMGSISDRIGRWIPLVVGALALVVSTVLFAYAHSLPALFGARLVQGAADAVTWVVGFALIADAYGVSERGRVMGFVMAGANFGFMIGPTLGGWLYEAGGIHLPFLVVAALGLIAAVGFIWIRLPVRPFADEERRVPLGEILSAPEVRRCALAVVITGGTISMLEPVLSLFLADRLNLGPARIGLVFGAAAVAATLLHPLFGRLADRVGGRRLTFAGLMAIALVLPVMGQVQTFRAAVLVYMLQAVTIAIVVTPSLTYMAEAVSSTGVGSFGVAYGVYNFSWAAGLLVGPAIGGFVYERASLATLTLVWSPLVLVAALALNRTSAQE